MDSSTLSLCSGGGGLDIGVERALRRLGRGMRQLAYVEREAYACAVLAARMEEGALAAAPIWSDLETFDARPLAGHVELVVAGVPCQGNSLAGKRRGVSDERWLWPHVERVLSECRPAWFFLENVRGLLSVNGGEAFGAILEGLAQLGFNAEWLVLRASEIGAPHRRERVFLLAHASSSRLPRRAHVSSDSSQERATAERGGGHVLADDLADADCMRRQSERRGRLSDRDAEPRDDADRCSSAAVADAQLDALRLEPERHQRQGRRVRTSVSRDAEPRESGAGALHEFPPRPEDVTAWRAYLQRFPDRAPAVESALRRGTDGLAGGVVERADVERTEQLRLLGNGVVPAQAESAFLELRERFAPAATRTRVNHGA